MKYKRQEIEQRSRAAGVVPVLTISDAGRAVPLAAALIEGGLDVLEITLRTPAAIDAISAIVRADLDCVVGAGTILSEGDVSAAHMAGAEFLVTPGTPQSLIPVLLDYDGLVIPGAATATEALTLQEAGFDLLKFFPAEASGGAPFLKSLAGPLPDLRFMPTGGVREDTLGDYLSLPNVLAAGGTWIAPDPLINAGDWAEIKKRATEACQRVQALRNPAPA